MNSKSLIAAMLAGRQLVRSINPELLRWSGAHWEAWLNRQRGTDMARPQHLFVAAAALTCLEDLPLHVGLMQVMTAPGVRLSLLLTLPTEELAQIARAQARREGWEMLVHLHAAEEAAGLLRDLPEWTPLAFFPRPSILSEQSIGAALRLCESSHELQAAELDTGIFLGRAVHYGAWAEAHKKHPEAGITSALQQLVEQDPEQLAAPSNERQCPLDQGERNISPIRPTVDGSCVQVPRFDDGDELTVATLDDREEPVAFVRRSGVLCGTDRRLRIRTPGALLTTTPQKIRFDVRSANSSTITTILPFHVPPSRLMSWMVSAFLNRGGAGNSVIRAFARGIGCRLSYAEDEPETLRDIPVVWGVLRGSDRILARAKAQNLYFFYVDHAYFNRGHGKTYRITRNAYEAGRIRLCPDDRLRSLNLDLRPWRKSGREIIVCPPTEYFMKAHGCADWLETTVANLRRTTDRPIVVREKPQTGEEAVPLQQALQTAHALVTHSSNVAIEAACLGTPVFVSTASAAAPIGRTDVADIESPIYPDRRAWLAHLAYNQFSFDEIESGTAWQMLLALEERKFV